jgi:hypothetical protein
VGILWEKNIYIIGDNLSVIWLELEGKKYQLSAKVFQCFCLTGSGVSIFSCVYAYVFQNHLASLKYETKWIKDAEIELIEQFCCLMLKETGISIQRKSNIPTNHLVSFFMLDD